MRSFFCAVLMVLGAVHPSLAAEHKNGEPLVALETAKGRIVIALWPEKAPATVANFLAYVDAGFYDGTLFHRVIPNFMIQGGGFSADMKPKAVGKPIPNEADNGLKNVRGTIAMARTGDPHSATSQFFINCVDNDFLNHRGRTPAGWGYAVFGRVVEGMAAVDAISAVKTGRSGVYQDVPIEPLVILRARRLP